MRFREGSQIRECEADPVDLDRQCRSYNAQVGDRVREHPKRKRQAEVKGLGEARNMQGNQHHHHQRARAHGILQ